MATAKKSAPKVEKVNVAKQVREAYQSGSMNYAQLAEKFNLNIADILSIIEGTIDKNTLKNIQATAETKAAHPATTKAIKEYYQSHSCSYFEVAQHFGISTEEVAAVLGA